jgi:predicted nucleic acid-binding protein
VAKIVVDSYAWIEHFRHAGAGSSRVETCVERGDDLYTPTVVLAEVARKFHRDRLTGAVAQRRMEQIALMSSLVELDRGIAWAAAEADPELRDWAKKHSLESPGLFDAIILGTTRRLGAMVLTGDRHFEGLSETEWMG